VIVADDDGVCVVKRGEAAQVLENALRRQLMEDNKRGLYEAGKLSLDINNMRPQLEAKGLIYE
jgi:4-hydroxy-4-methyl-2-oxoglutarate aldolase